MSSKLFVLSVCVLLMIGSMAYAYTPVTYQKDIVASDALTQYYGIDRGDADTVAAGQEIYTTSYTAGTGIGALTQHSGVIGSWAPSIKDSAETPYYDVAVGDVIRELSQDQTYWIEQPHEVSVTTGNSYNLTTSASGSWVTTDISAAHGRTVSPNLHIGSTDIGFGHDGTGVPWGQAWWGSNEATSGAAYNIDVSWNYYGTETGYGWAYYPCPWDMEIADATALAGTEHTMEVITGERGAVNIKCVGSGTLYQTHNFVNFGVMAMRGVTVGDVRPADNLLDPDDPWAGPEIISSISQHTGYVPGDGITSPTASPQNFNVVMAINWKDPAADALITGNNYGNNAGVWAPTYTEDDVLREAIDGTNGVTKYSRRVAAGDLDGDGIDEMIVASYGTNPGLSIYWWDVTAGDWLSQLIDDTREYYDVRVSDVDGDGLVDILYAADGEAGILIIPEPATMLLLGIGSLIMFRRKRV